MEKKVQAGQKIWMKQNKWGSSQSKEPIEVVVEKVGSKYFTIVDRPREKYDVFTLQEVGDLARRNLIYLTLQEIKDAEEYNRLAEEVRKPFQYYGMPKLTLDQLRRIKAILDEK